jgi:hypothetical protein
VRNLQFSVILYYKREIDAPTPDWVACVAGPQFYGGPDLQRAGFWRAWGRIEGLQESPPFMTTRPSHNIINGFLKLTNKNSAAIGENLGDRNIFACM